jgi:hypothetical protein
VLDRNLWTDEFRKRLRDCEKPKNALRELTQKRCLEGSLLDLFYAYTFSPTLVFEKRAKARALALDGLRSVARRLKNASKQTQDTLDLKMMEGWDLTRPLRERARFKMPAGCYATTKCVCMRTDPIKDGHCCLPACRSIRVGLAGLSGPIRRQEPESAAPCSPSAVLRY